jgi:hypothetical protein
MPATRKNLVDRKKFLYILISEVLLCVR